MGGLFDSRIIQLVWYMTAQFQSLWPPILTLSDDLDMILNGRLELQNIPSFRFFSVNSHSKTEIVGRPPKSPQFSLFKTKSYLYNLTFLSTFGDVIGDVIVKKV